MHATLCVQASLSSQAALFMLPLAPTIIGLAAACYDKLIVTLHDKPQDIAEARLAAACHSSKLKCTLLYVAPKSPPPPTLQLHARVHCWLCVLLSDSRSWSAMSQNSFVQVLTSHAAADWIHLPNGDLQPLGPLPSHEPAAEQAQRSAELDTPHTHRCAIHSQTLQITTFRMHLPDGDLQPLGPLPSQQQHPSAAEQAQQSAEPETPHTAGAPSASHVHITLRAVDVASELLGELRGRQDSANPDSSRLWAAQGSCILFVCGTCGMRQTSGIYWCHPVRTWGPLILASGLGSRKGQASGLQPGIKMPACTHAMVHSKCSLHGRKRHMHPH